MAFPTPDPRRAETVVTPPQRGEGNWAGGPSALVEDDGTILLAYRLRRPVGRGRGYANVVARSEDGVHFGTVATFSAEALACDSLERPALVRTPSGSLACYLSLATPHTLHWRVVVAQAERAEALGISPVRDVLVGDPGTAYKDPVVQRRGDVVRMWVCRHLIADPERADAMDTCYGESGDGVGFELADEAILAPPASSWCRRGTRLAAVLSDGERDEACFDGRASFAENFEERTGFASGRAGGPLSIEGRGPIGAEGPMSEGALRYLSSITLADGGLRLYYELHRPDGTHELVTELVER